jgi:hypothetical protein
MFRFIGDDVCNIIYANAVHVIREHESEDLLEKGIFFLNLNLISYQGGLLNETFCINSR